MNYKDFQKHSFPEKSTFDRPQFDFFTNLTKWLAMRVGFILFKTGITANTLDIISILGSFFGTFLLVTNFDSNLVFAITGISLLALGIFVDFIDGPIARARGESSLIGDTLDDLGVDVVKASLMIVLAIFTEVDFFLIANVFTTIILFIGLPKTTKIIIKNNYWINNPFLQFMLNYFYANKYSFLGVRVMLPFLLTSILVLMIFNNELLSTFSIIVSQIYLSLALLWLFLLIFSRNSFN